MESDAAGPVSDADRERVTGLLREQMASGRLSLADYQARLRRVRTAATAGELQAVLRDLPGGRDADADAEVSRTGGPAAGAGSGLPRDGAAEDSGGTARRSGCAGVLLLLIAVLAVVAGAYS